jgi:hypothetical protein
MRLYIGILAVVAMMGTARAEFYANARYGYYIDVPKIFSVSDPESDSGDGRLFHTADKSAEVAVWGGWILDGGFADEVKSRQNDEVTDGWKLAYASKQSPTISNFSGMKDGLIFYAHIISRCKGTGYAMYRMEYPAADKAKYNAAIQALNSSLKTEKDSCS